VKEMLGFTNTSLEFPTIKFKHDKQGVYKQDPMFPKAQVWTVLKCPKEGLLAHLKYSQGTKTSLVSHQVNIQMFIIE
jgi:hypothetical protein